MSYWEERQIDIFKNSEMSVGKYFSKLEKSFIKTQRQLRQEIDSFYVRYAKESGISYADAIKELNKTELGELKDFIELSLANIGKYNKDVARLSLKARITRLEALETRIDLILRELYAIDYENKSVETLKEIYKESYLQSAYALDKYKGVHTGFVGINEKSIEKLIAYPFNGLNFSSRVWKQKEHLKSVLMEDITKMLIQGKHPNELANDMAKKLKVKRFEAYRLLHTESSFLTNEATMQAYKDDGMEKYQILGTLDKKTCSTCGEQDNKIYELEKGIVGVNQPPFHPLCRCTTVPYFEDEELENETRTARDKDGNYIDVPADMSYREWKEKFVDGKASSLTNIVSNDKLKLNRNIQRKEVNVDEIIYEQFNNELQDKLQKQSNNIYREFNIKEKEALKEYTQGGYLDINYDLAVGTQNIYTESLNNAIDKFKLNDNIITYRGTSEKYYLNYKDGDIFNGKVFYSTSINLDQAKAFADEVTQYNEDGYKGVLLEIRVPKDSKVLYIGENTNYETNEYELLLSNKTNYKLIKKENDKIILEVLK